jgi:septal ring factor EnvC (AmiA/AmiB activator)
MQKTRDSKQAQIDKQEAENENILATIVKREKEITQVKETLRHLEESKKYMLQQAVDKKIERAGNYKLVCKAISRRSTDLEAVKTLLTTDQILGICTITLKEAEKYLTKAQLDACTTKTISSTYKVVELYEPGGIDKCTR